MKFQETYFKFGTQGYMGVSALQWVKVKGQGWVEVEGEKKKRVEGVKTAGFSKMPSQGISTFRPDCEDTNTIYITIYHLDKNGEKQYIAEDLPHAKTHHVIITASGAIVDSKSSDPWLDKTGKNHKEDPCESCFSSKSLCTMHFVESRVEKIQKSIGDAYGIVQSCTVAQNLMATIEQMGKAKVAKKEEEARVIMKEIKTLADATGLWKPRLKGHLATSGIMEKT